MTLNKSIFQKEIRGIRKQGVGWGVDYRTPIEKSKAAVKFLIKNEGKPRDFDEFHWKFGIFMDKGGQIFPYDNLNWHTSLRLEHYGYTYRLFCVDTYPGEKLWCKKRFISVGKKDKIIWGSNLEKNFRSFNNEFGYYRGAYYDENFKLDKKKIRNDCIYCGSRYYYLIFFNKTKNFKNKMLFQCPECGKKRIIIPREYPSFDYWSLIYLEDIKKRENEKIKQK